MFDFKEAEPNAKFHLPVRLLIIVSRPIEILDGSSSVISMYPPIIESLFLVKPESNCKYCSPFSFELPVAVTT